MNKEDKVGQLNKLKICDKCKKEKKIYAKKLCKSCYNFSKRNYYKHNEYMKKWKENNPNYFKEYYRRKHGKKS